MNKTLEQLKDRNKNTIKQSSRAVFYAIVVMIVLGIVLLVIDSDRFLTASVLLIFFSIVSGIIALFLFALHKVKNHQIMMRNSIDIVYQDVINAYNSSKETSYSCVSKNDVNDDWLLVPSFANNEITYTITDSQITLYQATSFNKVGAEQKRTYYFTGLYILIDGPTGDLQFWSNTSTSEKIISMFKGLYGEDTNDVKQYKSKVKVNNGILYNNGTEVPTEMDNIRNTLNEIQMIKDYKIGLRNNKVHLALTLIHNSVPMIKKYKEKEYQEVSKVVFENLDLLETIKRILL